MKKILIVGAGDEQVSAIQVARDMGMTVLTTDMKSDAPGCAYAHKAFTVSTTDFKGTLDIARQERIDGIMTLCSETAVPVVARVASQLSLPGISLETALKATNKSYMREAMKSNNIPVPSNRTVSTYEEALTFTNEHYGPWVIKPSDGYGQRGTTYLSTVEKLEKSIELAKPFASDNKAIIEQFVSGPEINVTAIVNKGEVDILSLSYRETASTDNFGIALRHVAPVDISQNEINDIKELAKASTKAIGLQDGISYPQIVIGPKGPVVLEIAARIPGGYMREVAMYKSGVDMIKVAILQSLNENFTIDDVVTEDSYSAVSVKFITQLDIPKDIEKVNHVSGVDQARSIDGIKKCDIRLVPGQDVPLLDSSAGRFGTIIAVGDDREEVIQLTESAFNNILIQ